MDRIVILHNGGYVPAFLIDGRYWPSTCTPFACEQDARRTLAVAYTSYYEWYGERLPWDLETIPVLEVR